MLSVFSHFADWLVFSVGGLTEASRLGRSLHFFVEDTTKIFVLLLAMIYIIALVRASLNVERVRDYLAQKNRVIGLFMGSSFGAVTPFCSCSSIPVFLGFTSAGIPVGVTMSFLLTSPLINEIAVLLLLSLVGWKMTVIYVVVGLGVGITGGLFLEFIRAERFLRPFVRKAYRDARQFQIPTTEAAGLTLHQRHDFAVAELRSILSRVWKWVFIGVGVGAALHGYVPEAWFESHLGGGQWWSVPMASIVGIPLYSNATGVIPVMESLLLKGLPLGTTLAFCMSTVAVSFPEFVLLKQVMEWRLLLIVISMLLIAFTLVGWVLNLIHLL